MSDSPKAPETHEVIEKPAHKSVAVSMLSMGTVLKIGALIAMVVVITLLLTNQKSGNSVPATTQSQQGQTGKGADSKTEEKPKGDEAEKKLSATEVAMLALLTQMQEERVQERRNAVPVADPRAEQMKELRERLAATEQRLAEKSAQPLTPEPAPSPAPQADSELTRALAEMRALRQEMEAKAKAAAPQPQIIMVAAPQPQPVMATAPAPIARPAYVVEYHKPRGGSGGGELVNLDGRLVSKTSLPNPVHCDEERCGETIAAAPTPSCDCQSGTYCSGNTNNWSFLNDLIDVNIVGVGGGYSGGGYHTRHRTVEHHVVHHRPSGPPRCAPPPRCEPRPCPPNQRGPNPNGHRGNGNHRRR